MRFDTFRRTIVFVIALIALHDKVGPAQADFTPTPTPGFVSQFQSFVSEFPKWDTKHQDIPLVFLATTPEQQRPQALLMLWLLWLRDHQGTVSPTGGGTVASLPPPNNNPPQGGGILPGGGGPPGGGHTSGGSAPEPSSLALMGCGSLGLLAYRLIRSRVVRKG
ncbi:MAG TPA: PEP-CTERM sorting domain-containing protein [Gemmataceae bacterium]|nr:PEP-CTERM sorting domain-containing protein [Gemmataceae bacterium]